MSNPLSAVEGRRINPLWGVAIVTITPLVILLFGVLSLEASFKWGNVTTDKDGNLEYANSVSLPGGAVMFQAIGALIGASTAAYAGYKLSTKNTPPIPVQPLPNPPIEGQ